MALVSVHQATKTMYILNIHHFNLFAAELFQICYPLHAETSHFFLNLAKNSALKRLRIFTAPLSLGFH